MTIYVEEDFPLILNYEGEHLLILGVEFAKILEPKYYEAKTNDDCLNIDVGFSHKIFCHPLFIEGAFVWLIRKEMPTDIFDIIRILASDLDYVDDINMAIRKVERQVLLNEIYGK